MKTSNFRRTFACLLVAAICTLATVGPVNALPVNQDAGFQPTVVESSPTGGFGGLLLWFEGLWSPLASFWAMDGAKIMEGG